MDLYVGDAVTVNYSDKSSHVIHFVSLSLTDMGRYKTSKFSHHPMNSRFRASLLRWHSPTSDLHPTLISISML